MLKKHINIYLAIIVFFMIPMAIICLLQKTNFNMEKTPPETKKENVKEKNILVKVKLSKTNEIKEIPLEEYVVGVVAGEMPLSFHDEALKAQAIASRTYVVSKLDLNNTYDVVDTVSNQVYIDIDQMKNKWGANFENYYNKTLNAVNNTKNMIATYDNKPIITYYFAMSNGKTENSELVFRDALPYLKSVESKWDNENIKNYAYETNINRQDFCQKLNISCLNLSINIINRSESNRVNTIKINDQEIKGTEFRKIFQIRSTDFDIKVVNNNINIITKGYGHGVGMSQYGANGMANDGYNYEQILKHYYQNIEIKDINNV